MINKTSSKILDNNFETRSSMSIKAEPIGAYKIKTFNYFEWTQNILFYDK